MSVIVVIPQWTPPTDNTGRGRSWRIRWSASKATRSIVVAYAVQAGVKLHAGVRRKVEIACEFAGAGRLPDPPNLFKILLDALKFVGLIVDDSARWLVCTMPTVARGPVTQTTITFTDLPNVPEA